MKIKDIFLVTAIFCATVLPATMVVFGGIILLSSCSDTPSFEEPKEYGIEWLTGPLEGDSGTWQSFEEYRLGQQVFDTYTNAKFMVIRVPAGSKVKAKKAGTNKIEVITLNSPAEAGDTVIASRGVYHIPQ